MRRPSKLFLEGRLESLPYAGSATINSFNSSTIICTSTLSGGLLTQTNHGTTPQSKNVAGRKSDVPDCQWIQRLHTYGLLPGSFRPDDPYCVLRTYLRNRDELVGARSPQCQPLSQRKTFLLLAGALPGQPDQRIRVTNPG